MSNKRRVAIKREGARKFAPGCEPCFTYNGKTLAGEYDRACFLEGWAKAQKDHDGRERRQAEEDLYEQD